MSDYALPVSVSITQQQLAWLDARRRHGSLSRSAALRQVLDNLIGNAVKFSPPGRSIRISFSLDESHAVCRIQDEGPGFTLEDRSCMFQRYSRLSARPTGSEPSTGLGLSIVKQLMDSMGGELRCDSAPGLGTTFTLRFSRA